MRRHAKRTRRSRTATLVVLGAVVLTGCAQPEEPLKIGVREVANDIVLGGQSSEPEIEPSPLPPPPAIPPTPVVITLPGPKAKPRFEPTPAPSPTPAEACPESHPFDAPRYDARTDQATPPVEQVLTYRNEGEFQVSGANANEGVFAADTTREITDVVASDNGDFTFSVVAELEGTITTTEYEVLNDAPFGDPGGVLKQGNVRDLRGLYTVAVTTVTPDGTESTFRPSSPLLLVPFPAVQAQSYEVAGTDPLTGTTMSYTGTVGELVRINACGEPVQGLQVTLSDGRFVGPGVQVDFTATYAFATQYGAVSLEDSFVIAGTEAGATSSRTNRATVNSVPIHHTEVEDAEAQGESAS